MPTPNRTMFKTEAVVWTEPVHRAAPRAPWMHGDFKGPAALPFAVGTMRCMRILGRRFERQRCRETIAEMMLRVRRRQIGGGHELFSTRWDRRVAEEKARVAQAVLG